MSYNTDGKKRSHSFQYGSREWCIDLNHKKTLSRYNEQRTWEKEGKYGTYVCTQEETTTIIASSLSSNHVMGLQVEEIRTVPLGNTQKRVGLSAAVPPQFSVYITFFISSTFHILLFYLMQRFSLNASSIPYYNHKILFFIHTFYPLSFFHLLIIHHGPTAAAPNNVRAREQ